MNSKNFNDEEVSKALKAWQVNEALPPRFQERVWSWIEQAESVQTSSVWELASAWINQLFARPAMAVGYVSVLLAVGLLAGHAKVSAMESRLQGELAAKYVQAVDPYQRVPR